MKKIKLALAVILIAGCSGSSNYCEVKPVYLNDGTTSFPFPSDYFLQKKEKGDSLIVIPENFIAKVFRGIEIRAGGFSPNQSVIIPFSGMFKEGFFNISPEESVSDASPIFIIDAVKGERVAFEVEEHRADSFGVPFKNFSFIRVLPLKPYSTGSTYVYIVYENDGICASEGFEEMLFDKNDSYHITLENTLETLKEKGLIKNNIAVAGLFTVRGDEEITGFLQKTVDAIDSPSVVTDYAIKCTSSGFPSEYCKDLGLPAKIIHGYVESLSLVYPYETTGKIKDEYLSEIEAPKKLSVPFILALPESNSPSELVIFQHGFGDHKEAMFRELAYNLNKEGFAVAGIDVLFHGERKLPPEKSKNAGMPQLDLLGGDLNNGSFDPIALRDHLLQTVVDQNSLLQGIIHSFPEVDSSTVHYVGQSLGGILGTIFSAVAKNLYSSVINVGGGNFIRIMMGYQEIQPLIYVVFGTEDVYTQYLSFEILQILIDSADPANYARHIILEPFDGRSARHILLQEAIGDLLVANDSTEYLARAIDIPLVLPAVTEPPFLERVQSPVFQNLNGNITGGLYQFAPATHGFLLTISDDEPWKEAQEQVVQFFLNDRIEQVR